MRFENKPVNEATIFKTQPLHVFAESSEELPVDTEIESAAGDIPVIKERLDPVAANEGANVVRSHA